MDPLDVINRTGAAAFATDETGRITIWNKGAEKMLGYPAAQVLGKNCHEILHGLDIFGNRFCDRPCALNCMVQRRETVRHFELDVCAESGARVSAGISIVVVPGARAHQHTLIHFLEPVDRHREVGALLRRILNEEPVLSASPRPAGEPVPSLTAREVQILRMMREGKSTRGIADTLCISIPTTRNHIQSIFRKLDVHSKLEAVSLALRTNLL